MNERRKRELAFNFRFDLFHTIMVLFGALVSMSGLIHFIRGDVRLSFSAGVSILGILFIPFFGESAAQGRR